MAKKKRTAYQKWYYETYTKKRRANGVVPASTYKKKSPEERKESFQRAAQKRIKTMVERYGKDGVAEIHKANGQRLASQMAAHPERRYRPTTEKAREMARRGAEVRRRKKEEQTNEQG